MRTIICYLKPLSDAEIESINKYWELDDALNGEFKRTLKEIDTERVADCGTVSSLVKKTSCLLPKAPMFVCKNCNKAEPVKNRSQFLARLDLTSHECKECRKKRLHALKAESTVVLEDYLDKVLSRKDYFNNLSHLDCIVLLAALSDKYKERKPVFTAISGIDLTGSEQADRTALSQLIEIGAFINIKDLPEEVKAAETIVCGHSEPTIYRMGRHGYTPYLNPRAIERGIYFSLSLGFANVPEFLTAVYERALNSPITITECERLKRLAIDIRIENLYRLISSISREFKLEISISNPLAALVAHLAEKYPLTKCYYTLHYHAKEVVLFIHKKRPDLYTQSHLFTKFVSNYIQLVEEKGWELKLTRRLPDTITTSNIEALVSQHFIDGHFNWHSLTADEVVERWLSKMNIIDSQNGLPQASV